MISVILSTTSSAMASLVTTMTFPEFTAEGARSIPSDRLLFLGQLNGPQQRLELFVI